MNVIKISYNCIIIFIKIYCYFVIFIFVKKIMVLGRKKETPAPEAPKTKVCPYCKSEIAVDATRCPHCTSEL